MKSDKFHEVMFWFAALVAILVITFVPYLALKHSKPKLREPYTITVPTNQTTSVGQWSFLLGVEMGTNMWSNTNCCIFI